MKKGALLFFLVLLFTPIRVGAEAQAYAVIDAETGRLLAGVNENVKLPIASLTKIWTALTVLETGNVDERVIVSSEAASTEGSSIYLKQGSEVKIETLLYGLMLRSGNDAAIALAEHRGGSIEGFVQLMNAQAQLYGLENTVFTNPSGLHTDEHLSTAYETALMLRYAMQNEQFRTIASSVTYDFRTEEGLNRWKNKHRLLRIDDRAIAGKTGYTKVAGRTLATYFEQDDKKIIVVTLNDGNDWNTHRALATDTFSTYKHYTVAKKGVYQVLPGMEAEVHQPIRILLTKDERRDVSHVLQIPRQAEALRDARWVVLFKGKPLLTQTVQVKRQSE